MTRRRRIVSSAAMAAGFLLLSREAMAQATHFLVNAPASATVGRLFNFSPIVVAIFRYLRETV